MFHSFLPSRPFRRWGSGCLYRSCRLRGQDRRQLHELQARGSHRFPRFFTRAYGSAGVFNFWSQTVFLTSVYITNTFTHPRSRYRFRVVAGATTHRRNGRGQGIEPRGIWHTLVHDRRLPPLISSSDLPAPAPRISAPEGAVIYSAGVSGSFAQYFTFAFIPHRQLPSM